MTTIPPTLPPVPPKPAARPTEARHAFFQIAASQAAARLAPASPEAAPAPTVASTPAATALQAGEPQTARPPRPGSILDIRV